MDKAYLAPKRADQRPLNERGTSKRICLLLKIVTAVAVTLVIVMFVMQPAGPSVIINENGVDIDYMPVFHPPSNDDARPDAESKTSTSTTQAPPTTTTRTQTTSTTTMPLEASPTPAINKATGRECYTTEHVDQQRIRLFADILDERPAANNESAPIFFHETSCLPDGEVALSVRQACAIESAARANPKRAVFVAFASPVGFVRGRPLNGVQRALAAYPNIGWRTLNLWRYAQQTPAEQWIEDEELFRRSEFPTVHMADLLKLISLFRWGGAYLDMAFVVRRSFDELAGNFIAEDMDGNYSNAIIGFQAKGIGHLLAEYLLTEYVRNYKGTDFASNGADLLKRSFVELCGSENVLDCPLVKVYRKDVFHAVYETVLGELLDAQHANASMTHVAVHMGQVLSDGGKVRLGEQSAYERLAREFCPNVFATVVGGEF